MKALLILLAATVLTLSPDPVVITTTADKELIPEGIAVHPTTGTIYLSSLHQQKIVAIERDGTVKDVIKSGEGGFMMGLGMKVDAAGKTLWACSSYNDSTKHQTGLFQIDLQTKKVIQTFLRTDTTNCFLNDLVIDKQGNIYASDTEQSSVFKLDAQTKKLQRWLQHPQLHWANGIALSADEKTLFVASGDKGLQAIDVATKRLKTMAGPQTDFYAIDGLAYYNNTLIGVVGWPQDKPQNHRVLQFHLANNTITKVDTLSIAHPNINCPTTVSIAGNHAYVLGTTNLGVYNRAGSSTKGILDSLQPPVLLQYTLPH